MIALLIVTVLVLGVAAFIYHGRASVYAQRDRLSVMEFVNGRLELLRAEPYTTVQPPAQDYRTYFMRRRGNGTWVGPRASTTREWVTINSANCQMPLPKEADWQTISGKNGCSLYFIEWFPHSRFGCRRPPRRWRNR